MGRLSPRRETYATIAADFGVRHPAIRQIDLGLTHALVR